jgi:hypothetical protein
MTLKMTSASHFLSRSINHSKMAEVETSEVGATLEPIGGFG